MNKSLTDLNTLHTLVDQESIETIIDIWFGLTIVVAVHQL